MTQHDIQAVLQRYTLHRGEDAEAPAAYRFWAYYAEMPGCVAQAGTPEAAIVELDTLMKHHAESALARGGQLPVPLVDRNRTQRLRIGPIFVGDLAELAQSGGIISTANETDLESRPGVKRGQMEDLAVA